MEDTNDSFDSASTSNVEIPALSLEEDLSCARRFVFGPGGRDIQLCHLPHPRQGTAALYDLGGEGLSELLRLDASGRSLFFGESVVKQAQLDLLSPVHPFLVLLPFIYKKKPVQKTAEEIFSHEQFPAISLLLKKKQVLDTLGKVTDSSEAIFYTYNREKLMKWLNTRFDIMKNAMLQRNMAPKAIRDDDAALRYYAFGVFSDNLCPELSAELTAEWGIVKPVTSVVPTVPQPVKRKAESTPKTVQKALAKQRQLKTASKGTSSIVSFFRA